MNRDVGGAGLAPLRALGALSLTVLASGCGAPVASGQGTGQHRATAACPLQTEADWQSFLETTVADETWVKTCASGHDCDDWVGAFRTKVETDIQPTLEACTQDIALNPPIARCTDRLRRFIPAWLRQHTKGSYGFSLDNASYTAAQTDDAPAGMMQPPPEILAQLPERQAIEQAAQENGWPYLTHDSAVGGVRLFVATEDRDGRFDQWFLFGLESQSVVPTGSVLSFIAIQKKNASGEPLDRVRIHFRDYRVSLSDGAWQLSLPDPHDAKCYACHPSGPRTLIPTRGSVLASAPVRGEPGFSDEELPANFAVERLRTLNERLLSYGLPDWNGSVRPEDHGPRLGESLGCTECHDGVTRSTLDVFTDETTLRRKMVDELSMRAFARSTPIPDERAIGLLDREQTQDPPLSNEEMAELEQARSDHLADYEAFMAQRFPTFRAWALAEPCDGVR